MEMKDKILQQIKENNIEFTRFIYVDNDGVIRGYIAVGENLEGDFSTGHTFSAGMPFFSSLDTMGPETRYGCAGELSGVPDLNTFRIVPYVTNSAAVICDFVTKDTHQPSEICARSALKNFIQELPFEVKAAYENEFYLLKRSDEGKLVPFDKSLCFATDGMNKSHQIAMDITRALQKQGIQVEKYYPEYGAGQHEIAIRYDGGLEACDHQVMFRETARGVAHNHGLVASFMPKPFQDQAGSGAHLHVSLWQDGKNVFYDENDPCSLSPAGKYFIGGMLKHVKALCAFTASTVNSYKRLIPHNWASAYGCYGLDNREAAVRIITGLKGREEKSFNLEFKPVDSACNPYLALTALIAAGMDGIKNQIDPGEPIQCDPESLSALERAERGIERLPETLGEAIKALQEDTFFAGVFGEVLYDEYIKLKRFDWNEYCRQVSDWEFEKYAETF